MLDVTRALWLVVNNSSRRGGLLLTEVADVRHLCLPYGVDDAETKLAKLSLCTRCVGKGRNAGLQPMWPIGLWLIRLHRAFMAVQCNTVNAAAWMDGR